MKKICFITTVSNFFENFVLKFAEYLHNNTDWDISFICNRDDEFASRLPKYFHYYPVDMKRGISIGGIKAMFEIKKIFKEQKFDLIQYSSPNASLYAALAGKLSKVPIRLYCQWGMIYVSFRGLKRFIFKKIEKFVCACSTWIEPDSFGNLNFSREEKLYKENSSVIWNGSACGIDLEKFNFKNKKIYRDEIRCKYKLQPNDICYGFVGRLTKDKGINELLEAFKKIYTMNTNSYLMIVGSNENDGTISNDLTEWSMKCPNVIYIGKTTEVQKYLSAFDLFVLPSYREGFGMSVIEAEAMGVPVIITKIPGPLDAIIPNKTGLVVEPKNVEDLVDAMQTLAKSETLRNMFSKNAVEFIINNFDQKKLFKFMLQDRIRLLNIK